MVLTLVTLTTFSGWSQLHQCDQGMLQIGFLENLIRSFSISYISYSPFSEDLSGYIPGILTTTMQPRRTLQGHMCEIKEITNLTKNADL